MDAQVSRGIESIMANKENTSPTTLGYALLGLLARGDRSGYDLAQGLKKPVGFFWYAQHSQIYPELARLEAASLIHHTRVEQSDRPDKKVYHLTPSGTEALRTWLEAPTEITLKRDELVLKAFSIWLAAPAIAATMMREHAQAHATRQAEYEQHLAHIEAGAGDEMWNPHSPWFGIHAALRRGIGYEREYSAWCEWMAECLSRTTPVET